MMGLHLTIHAQIPHLKVHNIQWGQKGIEKLRKLGYEEGEQYSYCLQYIYDKNYNIITELNNLYQEAQKTGVNGDSSWVFDDAYIEIEKQLIPFEKIHYSLTYSTATSTSEMHYDPVIYIKSVDGTIEQLIDADDLKNAYYSLNMNTI